MAEHDTDEHETGADEHGDCRDALHEIYHFLDGEITDADRDRIRVHLEDCPPCFEAFDFEAELKQVIQSRCREQVPDSLRQRIADAIGHE